NVAPVVSLTAPAPNSQFQAGDNVRLTATASDPDGTVDHVKFLQGTTVLGQSSTSPFTVTWNRVGEGIYALTAVAFDNDGARTTSSPISISVVDPNPPALISAVASAAAVTVTFSKGLSVATATNRLNYAIDGGVAVATASLGATPNIVVLGVGGLTIGPLHTLTVNHVQDPTGQEIAPNSQTT